MFHRLFGSFFVAIAQFLKSIKSKDTPSDYKDILKETYTSRLHNQTESNSVNSLLIGLCAVGVFIMAAELGYRAITKVLHMYASS